MKNFCIIFCTFCSLSFLGLNVYSDRLYTWTDNEGVVHITEDPPPKNAKNPYTVNFTRPPEQPRDQKQTKKKQQGNTNQRVPEERDKAIEATDTLEDESDYDYYYNDDNDAYFRHKMKEERQDKNREKHEDRIKGKDREGRNKNSQSETPAVGRR